MQFSNLTEDEADTSWILLSL